MEAISEMLRVKAIIGAFIGDQSGWIPRTDLLLLIIESALHNAISVNG